MYIYLFFCFINSVELEHEELSNEQEQIPSAEMHRDLFDNNEQLPSGSLNKCSHICMFSYG